jgi:hypothetical protein
MISAVVAEEDRRLLLERQEQEKRAAEVRPFWLTELEYHFSLTFVFS